MSNGKCYNCKHRRNVPGDAHSQCVHPDSGNSSGNMFDGIVAIASGNQGAQKLNIKANAHGVRSGWFMWPANFDPTWLENCDGYEAQEDDK